MITGMVLAGALLAQEMTRAEMDDEAGLIGAASVAIGVCGRFGYNVHPNTLDQWTNDFSHRAEASGWDEEVVAGAARRGAAEEQARLDLQPPPDDLTTGQLRIFAVAMLTRIKGRCRQLDANHAGLVSDLSDGDRNADAQFASVLQPLD